MSSGLYSRDDSMQNPHAEPFISDQAQLILSGYSPDLNLILWTQLARCSLALRDTECTVEFCVTGQRMRYTLSSNVAVFVFVSKSLSAKGLNWQWIGTFVFLCPWQSLFYALYCWLAHVASHTSHSLLHYCLLERKQRLFVVRLMERGNDCMHAWPLRIPILPPFQGKLFFKCLGFFQTTS